MADKIVVEYDIQLQQAEAELKGFEKELRNAESIGKKSMNSITAESKKTSGEINKTSGSVTNLSSKFTELANNLPFAGQIKQVAELGSAVTGLGGAAKASSAGFQILRVAMLSTGIPLLVAAIVGLIAYFKRTDEGATRLQGVMSALGATLDLVSGAMVGIGEATFKAFESFANFKEGVADLGNILVENIVNRGKAVFTFFEALNLAVGGDFVAAGKRFIDSTVQLTTGITDITSKTGDFVAKAQAAAQAAFEWESRMDALQDKIRDDSSVIKENNNEIQRLIIASKSKTAQDEISLANLDKAAKLEKRNLAIELSNASARLKLIQERNKRESDSINQDIKNGEARRSINDDLAQEEKDAFNAIIELQGASDALLERIQNRRDTKEEEIFQNQIKRIGQEEVLRENVQKEALLNGVVNAEEYEESLYLIKLDGLNRQKELLVENGRDIVDIDKAILDLQLANLEKSNKEAAAKEKEARDLRKKADEEAAKETLARVEQRLKEEEELNKQQQQKIGQIREAGFQIAEDLAKGFADISAEKRQAELDEESEALQEQTESKISSLQKQLDSGLITEEQFAVRKEAIDRQQASKEAEIKTKKFQADKKAALTQVAIDTALAIAKSFAQLGPIGGALGAALAAAAGLAQAALISSKPVPKFKDGVVGLKGPGTGTSDSIPAFLSRGESVVTARATSSNMGLLKAMNEGREEDYIEKSYISPALRKIEIENNRLAKTRREAKEKRMLSKSGNQIDLSNTDRLIKKNSTVKVSNLSDFAKEINKQSYYSSFK
jgi:hypothetical protein